MLSRLSLRNVRVSFRYSAGLATKGRTRGYVTNTDEEIEELREATIDFCKREITPEVASLTDSKNSFPNELWPKLGAAGLLGITAKPEYGGLGLGYFAHSVVMEEMSRASGEC